MQYRVLVQSHNNLFVATVFGFPDLVAEGHTRDEAIERARVALTERLAHTEMVTIEVAAPRAEASQSGASNNPWLREAGRFRDDPTFDDLLGEIERVRRTEQTP